jgi:hypothetical protein
MTQIQYNLGVRQNASEFNSNGYFEDTWVSLLLDNVIRFTYGVNYSFLYTQDISLSAEIFHQANEFGNIHYDLDSNSVEIPDDYEKSIQAFTGNGWDVWGLTRMQKNGDKWYRAYSNAGVDDAEKCRLEWNRLISDLLQSNHSYFLKDPRLVYLLQFVPIEIPVIVVERKSEDILSSMKRHYGPNIFSKELLFGSWVSNHFNYKIGIQTWSEYLENYSEFLRRGLQNREHFKIKYEDLHDSKQLSAISGFLGRRIEW